MASIDRVSERIFRQNGVWIRLLIGGGLVLSIIGLPVAFGYLFAFAFNLQRDPEAELPPWENWPQLFIVGLHALAVFLAWFCLPVGAAMLLATLFSQVPGGVLGIVGWLAVGSGSVASLAVFASALCHYQREQRWSALLEFERLFHPLESTWKTLVIPGLAWVGLMAVGYSLLPFAFFLGTLVFLAYAIPIISGSSRSLHSKP